jgi:hypothetical protein
MDNAIRKRKLKIVLGGACGNVGLSYHGMELLPELFRNALAGVGGPRCSAADALARDLDPYIRTANALHALRYRLSASQFDPSPIGAVVSVR